jgi:hypothetical protein
MTLHMRVAIFIAMFVALAAAVLPSVFLAGKHWKAAEDKARERRMAEHRMNARLLRLNI